MDKVRVDRDVLFGAKAQVRQRCQNKDAIELWAGDVVVLDTTNSSGVNVCVTTSNTSDDVDVFGVAAQNIAAGDYGEIIVEGPVEILRADGNTNIGAGDELAVIDGSSYADYATGTVSVNANATAVTGSGTTFTAAMVGRYIRFGSEATKYRITARGSATALTITPAYRGSANLSGSSYNITAKGRAMKATAGKGGAFATSLEAYTTNDCAGVLDAVLFKAPRVDSTAGGNTLDGAYDQGGAGSGRAITVNDGAITMTKNDAGTENVLELSASPSSSADGDALKVTCGSNSTGVGIQLANTGSGNDVAGSGDTWTVSKAGAAVFTTLSSTPHTLLEGTNPAGTNCYIGRDNTGDVTVNALTSKSVLLAVAGTDVVTVAGAAVTVAQALTVSTGGITVTGNSTITGDLAVTGSLTFGGNWTVGATLTVDELILDTDGSAPAGTNCYLVQDNTGDVTVNCLTGKTINLAVNGTDEYAFGATSVDLNGNHLDNAGYLIVNEVTKPAGTECYVARDNTGDTNINALTSKKVNIEIAGTDEFRFSGTAFEIASANNIQFLGDNGILDSAGNEVIMVEAVGSAVNYLNVKNAATANNIVLECLGTADKGFTFTNDQDEEILILTPQAGGDTELTVLNAAAAQPIIRVTGTADTGVEIQNAAGEIMLETLSTADPVNWLSVSNADTGNPVILLNPGEDDIGFSFQAKNAEEILILAATAAATSEVTITSSATDNPTIAATGDNANIDLDLTSKGTGLVKITTNGLDMATNTIYGGTGANENLVLQSTENATKGYVGIANGDEGLKVGGTADRAGAVGDNAVHIFNGAAAPAGALANGISLYSEGGECKVLDAAGNSTTLSPHTEDGDYVVFSYSVKKDETVMIHLEKMMKLLEEKLGDDAKGLIEVFKGEAKLSELEGRA